MSFIIFSVMKVVQKVMFLFKLPNEICRVSHSLHKTSNPDVGCVRNARSFCLSDDLEEKTGFVWNGKYTYIYTDPDSYDPLAQVHD